MQRTILLSDLVSFKDAIRPLNKAHVEHIIANNLEGFPPIDVTPHNQQFLILNGYHRFEAARKLKLTSIEANVHSFANNRDMLDFVYASNLTNGLAFSRKDKEKYIVFLSGYYPELSQEQIADKVKLDRSTVSKTLKRLGMNDTDVSSEEKLARYENREYGLKLFKAFANFFENEKGFGRGKLTSKAEEGRAKLLCHVCNNSEEMVDVFESLARSLTQAASIIREGK